MVPFKSIYNNDFTNVTTCVWSAHAKGQPFAKEMLEETIKEVTGYVDAHFLQLATGRVPWYQSKLYSMAEHRDWWCKHFGIEPDHPMWTTGYNKYLLDGGDPLADFIGYCKKYGQAAFVSMRMNDAHCLEWVDTPGNTMGSNCISRFYADHPEYRLTEGKGWYERGLNWIHDEVRSSLLEIIEEQVANYELDGFELDFQRHPRFFVEEETPSERRAEIVTGFISKVRAILDRCAKNGKKMYLSVRIPCYLAMLDDCGIDPSRFEEAGVDMCVVSDHYFAALETDFAKIVPMLGRVPAYFEMCHTTYTGKNVGVKPGQPNYDSFSFRRTTPEQYRTYANVAYRNGAAGMYFFNFAYYREHGTDGRGPFAEPPFAVMGECRDPVALAEGPQDYLLTPGWSCWGGPVQKIKGKNLPRILHDGVTESFRMEIYPQKDIKNPVSRLRIQTDTVIEGQKFELAFNGVTLAENADISEPFGEQYPPLLGNEYTLRAFDLPVSLIKEGMNDISITMTGGDDVKLIIIDIPII